MRKRAQRKSKSLEEVQRPIVQPRKITYGVFQKDKKWWIAISLISIFFLVLLLNTYFNVASGISYNSEGEGLDKYYLSGPDPYYNMRLVENTIFGENPGNYPFYSEKDPLLDYPNGKTGGRPPLLNMMAIGFSRLLLPFMNEVDALGYSMQFIPALFGALLVFPVYFLAKAIFGRKEGLLAALFLAIIPIHLGSGHGSAFTLFDHDSFNLFLYFMTFAFLIMSVKEKETIRSILLALLGGVFLAALSMTWVEARYLSVIIAVYAIVQIVMDIFTSKIYVNSVRSPLLVLTSGYLISLPVISAKYIGYRPDIPLYLIIGLAIFGFFYFLFHVKKIPWTLSLPAISVVVGAVLVFLFFTETLSVSFPFLSSLQRLADIIFGSGIYGSKVSMTIAEAGTYEISRSVMSFGPTLYWLGWAGFALLIYRYYKHYQRRDFLFLLVLFLLNMWLTGVAGRFLNDLVPVIAILSGWIVCYMMSRFNYTQMLKSIRGAGGVLRGLRRGLNIPQIFGIFFVGFLVIFPNAYLAFDAAIPVTEKEEIFGDLPSGAFGLGHGKEVYWVDAYSWLKQQDTHIMTPVERPGYISWWDYGFYESALGGHPTVADNFQDGIPTAANFHTATSEEEAVSVWIVRLLEGNVYHNEDKTLSPNVISVLKNKLGKNDTQNITAWLENPLISPSYGAPIGAEYNEDLSKNYPVGQQWPMNAVYHDITQLLMEKLDDEGLTWLYHDIQQATGYSIRYYGVEGYDKQIFNIFGFLADKSLLLVAGQEDANPEDDFNYIVYVTEQNNELNYSQLKAKTDAQLREDPPVNTKPYYKDAYFNTMFYRTYIGIAEGESGGKTEPNYQFPCVNMRHFCAEFISDIVGKQLAYYPNKAAVVIAKYYAGAFVNGSVTYQDEPLQVQVVVQKNISHYGTSLPIDHDQNFTTSSGNFSVIVPAGNVTLQIRRYPELGASAFPIKNVTFNGVNEYAPITEDEAMRRGGNYHRRINVTIEPAQVSGYVYKNNDTDESYNRSIDQHLPDVNITIVGVQQFNPENGQVEQYDYTMLEETTTDSMGYYKLSGLLPGYYQIVATIDGFIIENILIDLPFGNTTHNISKPELGGVEGIVFFDENNNGIYDVGEEMSDVDVNLSYTALVTPIFVDSVRTDSSGQYQFMSLIPGEYSVNATKRPEYEIEVPITIEENKTISVNISLEFYPVTITGITQSNVTSDPVGNITIRFTPDTTVDNNTAQFITITSNENGYYSTKVMPGYYNISVDQLKNVSGINVSYTYTGTTHVQVGEGTKELNFILQVKEEE